MSTDRRSFLKSAAALAATSALPFRNAFAAGQAKSPHIAFPSDPRARIAISGWAFRSIIDAPLNDERDPKLAAIDMKDFGAHVREKFNVVNVEPYNRYFRSLEPSYLDSFRNALAKSGTHAANLAADMDHSYLDDDAAIRKEAVAEAKKWIDVAAAISSPSIRTSMSSPKNPKPNLDRAIECLKPVADHAAAKNVVLHLENDNLISEDAFFIEKVVRTVNHPFVHALPDFGNSYGSGDPVFAARAVKTLFPLAYGMSHVKPSSTTAQGKEIQVDLAAAFAAAKSAGYKGYFSMEYEGKEEIHSATAKLIEQSLKLM